jgi:ribonuclease E
MASPDESRVDEARDQSGAPVSPDPTTTDSQAAPPRLNGGSAADEPSEAVSPGRPRGTASFPGGPPPSAPPVTTAPAEVVTPSPSPPAPDAPPQFRVTTVEPTAASFPGGPPPSAPAPGDTPASPIPAAAASTPTPAAPAAAPSAPATPTVGEARGGTPAPPVEDHGAPPAAPVTEEAGAPEPAAPVVDQPEPAGTAAEAAEPASGRPGGRRRRRGRGGKATVGEGAEGRQTAAAEGREAAAPEDGAAAEGRPAAATEAHGSEAAEPGEAVAAEARAAVAVAASGSARTRARRRRRAAAKARNREASPDAPLDEPVAAPARSGEAVPAADDPPSGRRGRRTAAAAVTVTEGPDETAPPARAGARPSRRGGAAGTRASAPEARAANGEPAAETAGERGGGRTRRRGRGRLAAAEDDTATATAPEAAPTRPATAERSTRLETRGRAGRQADRARRRRAGLTEEQKRVLRQEGPDKRMLVTEGAERTQIGVLEGPTLVEHYVTRKAGRSMVGNIYLGRVQNVLPGMEAAFIDIGRGRNAVLYAGEVNYSEEDLDGEAPRIERVLKPGQPVLVQVTKDPIGAKGARLTAQVSLAGRYLVLQPEDNTFGISRRLPEEERARLREILKEVRPKGLGLIVRTAAEGASADDLRADLARLQARWEAVERKAKKASAPAVIYSEPELVVRVIRDIFAPDFAELVVDDDELYERVHEYLQEVAPDLLPKLHRHDGALPLFEEYRVVEQIHKALERKVWLPSGGSIMIDRTEAMTVIDVNTGKFVGRANLEETVVANNLEAADEIVRQLRLRDIGGIIIIDFIDMLFERNQQAVVDRLRDALTRDKTKSQVMEVSSLGLVQMTRKRVSGGLLDSFSETCPTCDGRGVVITLEI